MTPFYEDVSTTITDVREKQNTHKGVAIAASCLPRATCATSTDDGDGAATKTNLASDTSKDVQEAKLVEQAVDNAGLHTDER